MSTKEDIFENYTPPSYLNREPQISEDPIVEEPKWFDTEEGMKDTYNSEDLSNYNVNQQKNIKAKLDALKRFLDEAVSKVDLPTLTIPMDDKGEQ